MFNNSVLPRREYSLSSLERQNLKAPTSVVFQWPGAYCSWFNCSGAPHPIVQEAICRVL